MFPISFQTIDLFGNENDLGERFLFPEEFERETETEIEFDCVNTERENELVAVYTNQYYEDKE